MAFISLFRVVEKFGMRQVIRFSWGTCSAVLLLLIASVASCVAAAEESGTDQALASEQRGEEREIRSPAVSGQWYPSGKKELAEEVDGYLAKVPGLPAVEWRIIGIISPHAGFVYSGPVAAYGYRLLKEKQQKVKTAILIGPSHRYPLSGVSVNNVQDYRTPLGDLFVDKEIAGEIVGYDRSFRYVPEAHAQEHSLESQLPFLQRTLGNEVKIVPVLLNDISYADKLSWVVSKILKEHSDVIVIASTDMSHYRPYNKACGIDEASYETLKALDVDKLEMGLKSKQVELCGGAGVLAFAKAARALGAKNMVGLKYANSGDTAGSMGAVVGYCSLAVSIPSGTVKTIDRSAEMDEKLTESEKQQLLAIARDTIVEYVRNHRVPKIEVDSDRLNMKRGAFVTIKRKGDLRGCIGRFSPVSEPLYRIIQQMAVAASTQDPRFSPMSISETDDMELEISVLSDLSRIDSIDEIEVGVHGLEIEQGPYRGVLLPQVATENHWNKTTFLEQTCRKAGLPRDAYKKGAIIYVFSAQVFGEKD
ncbi:MAG: AmmeMemoRadiSam system protein B [Candidatus Coatesbacteria bacterium]|nr:AmmeMemoRadiSam system protein B [Candidatus Coatesbacteria bacterium]